MKYFFSFIAIAIFLLMVPGVLQAAAVYPETDSIDVTKGDEFLVTVKLTTEEKINAIEGVLIFDPVMFKVSAIHDGNSSVNFWIDKLKEKEPGKISFSGITPGGIQGNGNVLFSVVLVSQKEGESTILIGSGTILKNDGSGNAVSVSLEAVTIRSVSQANTSLVDFVSADAIPPERFLPAVGNDTELFGGRWFISFAAQDKQSGIDRYEVKEYRLFESYSEWTQAESPHLLSDQSLRSVILVRAIDTAGNVRIESVTPSKYVWYGSIMKYGILIVCIFCIFFFSRSIWKKKNS